MGPVREVTSSGAVYLGDRSAIGTGKPEGRLVRLGVPDSRLTTLDECISLFEDWKARQKDIFSPLAYTAAKPDGDDVAIQVVGDGDDPEHTFTLTLQSERHVCRLLGIPADYFTRRSAKLRADMFNEGINSAPVKTISTMRMFRTMDDRSRAVVTDSYERYNNLEFAQELKGNVGEFNLHGAWLSDRRFDLCQYHPDLELSVDGGLGTQDKLYLGLHSWNGETGEVPFGWTLFMFRAICFNYNIWGFSEVTSGSHIHMGDVRQEVERMKKAIYNMRSHRDDAARIVTVAKDEVLINFSDDPEKLVAALRAIQVPKELTLGAVELAQKEFGGDKLTRWMLVQGMTHLSQGLSVDDRMDLDEAAGKVLVKLAL